jgi:hypothetical protein
MKEESTSSPQRMTGKRRERCFLGFQTMKNDLKVEQTTGGTFQAEVMTQGKAYRGNDFGCFSFSSWINGNKECEWQEAKHVVR